MTAPARIDSDIRAVVSAVSTCPDGIARGDLLAYLRLYHRPTISDRAMRKAIEGAREQGELIVWLDERYVIARSWAELREWQRREPEPRIRRLSQEISAMTRRAAVLWPEQLNLGIAS